MTAWEQEAPALEQGPAASWEPIDLTDVLTGTYVPEEASLMPRTDGHALLYRGRVHSFHGEPESGKSFIAQAEAARVLADGGRVLFVDFESDRVTVVHRLLGMGASRRDVLDRFRYVRPEASPLGALDERIAWHQLLAQPFDLAVLDGVTEALAVAGVASKDNDAVTLWVRRIPRAIAQMTGAAVVLIDHVTKDADSRGRYAIGGQAKLAALDGAAYVVDVITPLGRGLVGTLVLRIAKDRPGAVRPHAAAWRKSDRTAEAARVHVDSTSGDRIRVTIDPAPTGLAVEDVAPARSWRPTALMERLSRELEANAEPLSTNQLDHLCRPGKRAQKLAALDLLVAEEHVIRTQGPRRSTLHRITRPYRQDADPRSDRFVEREPLDPLDDLPEGS